MFRISSVPPYHEYFRRSRSTQIATASVLLGLVFTTEQGWSQETDVRRDYASAQAAMNADPHDLEKAFVFAEAAVEVGDLRGAITALERILLLDPSLTNIRLELGLLHLRAGSRETAASYLGEVVAAPETPPAMRQRAEELLAEAQTTPLRGGMTGSLTFGLRAESNANAAPDSLLVRGVPSNITDPEDESRDDIGVSASLDLRHLGFPLGQSSAPLATEISLYGLAWREVDTSDLAYLRVTTGPLFVFGPSVSLRPYLGGSVLGIGGAHFSTTGLIGAEFSYQVNPTLMVTADAEVRSVEASESDTNPTAERFEGNEASAALGLRASLSPGFALDARLFVSRFDRKAAFESNDIVGLSLGAAWSVPNPLGAPRGPATLRLSTSYAHADYDAPNPQIDAARRQKDDRWRIGASALLPLNEQVALDLGVAFTRNDSNLPNDTYENTEGVLQLRWQF